MFTELVIFGICPIALYVFFQTYGSKLLNFVAQILVDASEMQILSVTITDCDEESFLLNMSARISNTGPLPAKIASMKLSLYSSTTKNARAFACVQLPEITAKPAGVVCEVKDQRVRILDFEAFHVFNRNLVLQAELPVMVKGSSTLTIAGPIALLAGPIALQTTIKYQKTDILAGFDGVHIKPLDTRAQSKSLLKSPTDIDVDVVITSESTVSIDMGTVLVDIVHEEKQQQVVIANLRAQVFLKPGQNYVTWRGHMDRAQMAKHPLRSLRFLKEDVSKTEIVHAWVFGVGGDQCAWLDRTVKVMKSPIEMESTMMDLIHSTQS